MKLSSYARGFLGPLVFCAFVISGANAHAQSDTDVLKALAASESRIKTGVVHLRETNRTFYDPTANDPIPLRTRVPFPPEEQIDETVRFDNAKSVVLVVDDRQPENDSSRTLYTKTAFRHTSHYGDRSSHVGYKDLTFLDHPQWPPMDPLDMLTSQFIGPRWTMVQDGRRIAITRTLDARGRVVDLSPTQKAALKYVWREQTCEILKAKLNVPLAEKDIVFGPIPAGSFVQDDRFQQGYVFIQGQRQLTDGELAEAARRAGLRRPGAETMEEEERKRRAALLGKPGPELKAAGWLNTDEAMPVGLKGNIVLIDFWSTTCAPCVGALPSVQNASAMYAGKGVVVVGVHEARTRKEELASFVSAHHLTFPIAIDREDSIHHHFGAIMDGYGVYAVPIVAVLDRQGVVRYLGDGLEAAEQVVTALLASEK